MKLLHQQQLAAQQKQAAAQQQVTQQQQAAQQAKQTQKAQAQYLLDHQQHHLGVGQNQQSNTQASSYLTG